MGRFYKTVQMKNSVNHQKEARSPIWIIKKKGKVRIFQYLTRLSRKEIALFR